MAEMIRMQQANVVKKHSKEADDITTDKKKLNIMQDSSGRFEWILRSK